MYKILILALFVSCNAVAEDIFKCISKKGAVSFQNSPCPSNNKSKIVHSYTPLPPPTAEELKRNRMHADALDRMQLEMVLKGNNFPPIINSHSNNDEDIISERRKKTRMAEDLSATKYNNAGAINTRTGEFLAPAGEGYVGTRDGRFYTPAGPNGVIDTRTGQFIPMH